MAYSQGFNPHPKVSWVGAAPTGAASEAEYVEIQLVTPVDPIALTRELNAALPVGLDVLEAVVAASGSLPDRIDTSRWRLEMPGVEDEDLRSAAAALLTARAVPVERMTKSGWRRFDVRPAIVSLRVDSVTADSPREGRAEGTGVARACGILDVVVRQTTSPVVRPDDVLSAIRVVAALAPPAAAKATRIAQGRLDDDGRLVDPLAPDRGDASA